MTVGTLGLGSRIRSKGSANASLGRPTDNVQHSAVQHSSGSSSNRGFGLFDDDNDDDDGDNSDYNEDSGTQSSEPVTFTNDRSGFREVVNYQSSGDEGAITRSSRRSKLVTPSRSRTSRPSRRQTPYSNTTSRALMRARALSNAVEDEDLLITETALDNEEQFTQSIEKHKTKATMSGALASPGEDKKGKRSPKNKSVETPSSTPKEPKGMTWGTWLKRLAPQSVTKTVSSILGTPEPASRAAKDIFLKTPGKEEDKPISMPGSFEKPSEKDDPFYKNPNFLRGRSLRETSIPNPTGLFTYNHSGSVSPPESFHHSTAKQRLLARNAVTPNHRHRSASPAIGSAQKSTNFIARMRSANRAGRYDPYARPRSNAGTPVRRARVASPVFGGDEKPLTAEEELELLEHRERDRKVQEAEDRYLRREISKKLGRNVEEKEKTMVDAAAATSPIKKPREGVRFSDESEDDRTNSMSTTPPTTPPKSLLTPGKGISLEKLPALPQPLFKPAPPPSQPTSHVTQEWANPLRTPPSSFTEDPDVDSDKENISEPPPAPTMSHRKLPEQSLIPPPTPPPVRDGGSASLFPERPQPAGGFGINQPPTSTEPAPITRQPPTLDKHKPRVPSSLRNESSTSADTKENDISAAFGEGKENSHSANGEGSSLSSGFFKSSGKAFGGLGTSSAPSSSSTAGALREAQPNSITQAPKVDIRAKVAALPVKDLVELFSFPAVEPIKKGEVAEAAREHWVSKGLEDWGKNLFAEAAKNTTAVTV